VKIIEITWILFLAILIFSFQVELVESVLLLVSNVGLCVGQTVKIRFGKFHREEIHGPLAKMKEQLMEIQLI
jgi:hypothetical protein